MSLGVYAREALHELWSGLRSSLVPLLFLGLIGYLFIMLMSAEQLRQMGGANVVRNSNQLVYLMTSGQSFWLIFAWAWLFAQVVTRDRAASLHELVLSSPVSLAGLVFARYVGAAVLACLLGASSWVGFALVPLLVPLGWLPPEAVGATPYAAMTWAFLVFVVPSALGLGALYVAAALETRSITGPFAASALVILLWMVAMIVLREGSSHSDIATWIDVSGFGEAEAQTKNWTPREKTSAALAWTRPLLYNRLFWCLVPWSILALKLARTRREQLCSDASSAMMARAPADASGSARDAQLQLQDPPRLTAASLPSALRSPWLRSSWLRVSLSEAGWHLTRSLRARAFLLAMLLWVAMNVAGAFYHVVSHEEGPLVPRVELIAPYLIRLSFVFSVFAVAGFVGALARRDQRPGFDEMVDSTAAPVGSRVIGRALAASALTLLLALMPTVSAWILMGTCVPSAFAPWRALSVNLLLSAPALLELGALTFLVHSVLRAPGTAYGVSMLIAFIALVNHEVEVIAYPPGQVGIPAQVALSELNGWAPWLSSVLWLDAVKLAGASLLVALAWLAHPRGSALGWRDRLHQVFERLRAGAGRLVVGSAAVWMLLSGVLFERIVLRSGYVNASERRQADAERERTFWGRASAFSVQGGEVAARLDPRAGTAAVTWKLRGVRTGNGELHGALAPGMQLLQVSVTQPGSSQSRAARLEAAHHHFATQIGACGGQGCEVTLELRVRALPWSQGASVPWLHSSGIWARAEDLLPRLGYELERALRAPKQRARFGLPHQPAPLEAGALNPVLAVAPSGAWRWQIEVTELGTSSALKGAVNGGLDFALAWLPGSARIERTSAVGLEVWHGPSHGETAREIALDYRTAEQCLTKYLGSLPRVTHILQTPREHGRMALHGSVLWIPEHAGWDVASRGHGRARRRADLAQALAARWLRERADLRAEPGSRWLTDGVAGWLGLECVRASDGNEAWLSLLDKSSEHVAQAFGALDSPLISLAQDGAAAWVSDYAALATSGWAHSLGPARAVQVALETTDLVRAGKTVEGAAEQALGVEAAKLLFGIPRASEVTVSSTPEGTVEARGERFRWQGGGWEPTSGPVEAMRLPVGNSEAARRVTLPTQVTRGDLLGDLLLFDALPSYERSPSNNMYRAKAERARH